MIAGSQALNEILSALDRELSRTEERAHVVVVGGSALLALGVVERATADVDVVARREQDAMVVAEPMPAALAAAATRVAENYGLVPDWFNAAPTSLLEIGPGLPEGFADRLLRTFDGPFLTVDVASRIDLIFLKLYAFADRRAARDESDLRALTATAHELRAAARWARAHNMPGEFDDRVTTALAAFGVPDEGRVDD